MRNPSVASSACLLLACLLAALPGAAQEPTPAPTAAAPAPAPTAPPPPAGPQFADDHLTPGDREILGRAAQLVSRWAMVQRVVLAVRARTQAPLAPERVQAIDQAWQHGQDPEGLATALAKNECAQALQTLVSANLGYAEAIVTDDQGAIVCMTQRTSDFWQGDEEPWIRGWAGGSGGIFVSKSEPDASTGLDLVHIAVPVKSAGRTVGVLIAGKIAAPPSGTE